MIKIPGVNYEIQDDRVLLVQDAGSGEISQIELHRVHISHICQQMGMPILDPLSQVLARRLVTICEQIDRISGDSTFRDEIISRCGCGAEFLTELDSLNILAEEFCRDVSKC